MASISKQTSFVYCLNFQQRFWYIQAKNLNKNMKAWLIDAGGLFLGCIATKKLILPCLLAFNTQFGCYSTIAYIQYEYVPI